MVAALFVILLAVCRPTCAESFSQKFAAIKKDATKPQLYAFLYDVRPTSPNFNGFDFVMKGGKIIRQD